jgi:hypothetical protein
VCVNASSWQAAAHLTEEINKTQKMIALITFPPRRRVVSTISAFPDYVDNPKAVDAFAYGKRIWVPAARTASRSPVSPVMPQV